MHTGGGLLGWHHDFEEPRSPETSALSETAPKSRHPAPTTPKTRNISSLTPLHLAAMRVYLVLSAGIESLSSCQMHLNSALVVLEGSGRLPSLANFSSNSLALWISRVASEFSEFKAWRLEPAKLQHP